MTTTSTTPTWDTGEVGLWLDNDESLYHASRADHTPEALKALVTEFASVNPALDVDFDNVDWDHLADEIENEEA